VETSARMDATRATLLTLLAAVGIAAPAVGQLAGSEPAIPVLPPPYGVPGQSQPANPSVNVLPPRPLQMPTLPLLPNRAGGLIRSTQYVSPTAEPTGQPVQVDPPGPGQGAWLAPPVGAEAATAPSVSGTDWNLPATYTPNPRPGAANGTTWRWHGYGAANPGPVTPRRTSNSTVNYPPAYYAPEGALQPMTPLPMPTPQSTHMTPLPMPTPATASPVDMGPPTNVPDAPPPPMAPPLPQSATPHNGSAAMEPTWRSAGTQLAAGVEMPSGPEPWVAAGTRNSEVMRALYASNGWPYPVTARAASDAPAAPRPAVRQVSATSAAPAQARPAARPASTTYTAPAWNRGPGSSADATAGHAGSSARPAAQPGRGSADANARCFAGRLLRPSALAD
jgi:hypothetical protein